MEKLDVKIKIGFMIYAHIVIDGKRLNVNIVDSNGEVFTSTCYYTCDFHLFSQDFSNMSHRCNDVAILMKTLGGINENQS